MAFLEELANVKSQPGVLTRSKPAFLEVKEKLRRHDQQGPVLLQIRDQTTGPNEEPMTLEDLQSKCPQSGDPSLTRSEMRALCDANEIDPDERRNLLAHCKPDGDEADKPEDYTDGVGPAICRPTPNDVVENSLLWVDLPSTQSTDEQHTEQHSPGLKSREAAEKRCLTKGKKLCGLEQLERAHTKDKGQLPTGAEGGCKWGFIRSKGDSKGNTLAALCPLKVKMSEMDDVVKTTKTTNFHPYCCDPEPVTHKGATNHYSVTPRVGFCMQADFAITPGVTVSLGLNGVFKLHLDFGRNPEKHRCPSMDVEASIGVFLGFTIAGSSFGIGFSATGTVSLTQVPSKPGPVNWGIHNHAASTRVVDLEGHTCHGGGMFSLIRSYIKALVFWHRQGQYQQDKGKFDRDNALNAEKIGELLDAEYSRRLVDMTAFLSKAKVLEGGEIEVKDVIGTKYEKSDYDMENLGSV
jgi:hypothetical protein